MADVDYATSVLCGEFTEAVYDTINGNEGPFLYFPLFGKSLLCRMLPVNVNAAAADADEASAYRITRYLYCTTQGFAFWPTGTSWIGYIAECSAEMAQQLGRRDIVVAIRGTLGTTQWIQDFAFLWSDFPYVQTPASGTKVHSGFLSIYTSTDTASSSKLGELSMRDQIFKGLRALLDTNDANSSLPVRITITGHSLGAALATLAACDVGCNIATKGVTVGAVTFGSPKVGNDAFKKNAESHTAFIWRFRSVGDPVPLVPPSIWPLEYVHVGTELILDWSQSPYVSTSITQWLPFSFKCHNLELHLHVVAADQSSSTSVRTSMDGILPDLAAIEARGSTYVLEYLSSLPAWDAEEQVLLKGQLQQVVKIIGGDQKALIQFLREVAYIAAAKANPVNVINTVAASAASTISKLSGRSTSQLTSTNKTSAFDKRDYALVNKSDSILKAELGVPESWLVHPYKDMAYGSATKQWLPRVNRPQDIPHSSNEEYN